MGKGNNAVISGSGQLSGGNYEFVTISGSGVVNGDIVAADVKISGSAKFRGNVSAREVKVSGSARIKGSVEAGEVKFSGSGAVDGHLHAQSIHSSGSLSCKDAIRSEKIKISGHLSADGDVEAESFKSSGGFKIKGLLNASQIHVRMNGMSYAREIGGDRIEVEVAPFNFFWRTLIRAAQLFGWGSRLGLRSELIEGTDVTLEWTEARVVRGQRVGIGPGCRIDLVEYSDSIFIDPEAEVKEQRHIG